jgi:hypothetical protein
MHIWLDNLPQFVFLLQIKFECCGVVDGGDMSNTPWFRDQLNSREEGSSIMLVPKTCCKIVPKKDNISFKEMKVALHQNYSKVRGKTAPSRSFF